MICGLASAAAEAQAVALTDLVAAAAAAAETAAGGSLALTGCSLDCCGSIIGSCAGAAGSDVSPFTAAADACLRCSCGGFRGWLRPSQLPSLMPLATEDKSLSVSAFAKQLTLPLGCGWHVQVAWLASAQWLSACHPLQRCNACGLWALV